MLSYDTSSSSVHAAAAAYGEAAAERARGRVGAREAMHLLARTALTGIDKPHGMCVWREQAALLCLCSLSDTHRLWCCCAVCGLAGGRIPVSVSDAMDGTYRCAYRGVHAGEYELHVQV